ncbi:tetratricopeptide repeat protein [Catenulispora pinisilvae]|uniref:tetratricopeptide repeat protein n=1 Tax=Catenulispora pinisilvae TaxID=2705253 RepID=UPI001891B267|nr:tetratricopeptide repeat protein [Catenulispora pinisilvae]
MTGAHQSRWVVLGAGAIFSAIVAVAMPLRDAVGTALANHVTDRLARRNQVTTVLREVAPGRRRLQQIKDLVEARDVLGVHRAIPLPQGADAALSREFPLYVRRDLHSGLADWVTAKRRTGGLLLLAGPAGVGKTRCAFEVLHQELPDAEVFIPQNTAQLTSFAQSTGRELVVVWLNEIYNFLGPDKLTAELVRRLLNHARPILIVATIWTSRLDLLTGEGAAELNEDAFEILTVLAHVEHLPARFSDAELARAADLQHRDPRLRDALANADAELAGVLAAKPVLLAHWGDPSDPYAHAVLAAGIAATVCGHPNPIPSAVLEALAIARLDPRERAEATIDWFHSALAGACRPLAGLAVAVLEPCASTPGTIDGYRPHDILAQCAEIAVSDREILTLIASSSPRACHAIAVVVEPTRRGLPLAIAASRKAATDDDLPARHRAAFTLAVLLRRSGDTHGEQVALRLAMCATTDPARRSLAATSLGVLLQRQSDIAGAQSAYRAAMESGHPAHAALAALSLGSMLAVQGDTDSSQSVLAGAVASGYAPLAPGTAMGLALLHNARGDRAATADALRLETEVGPTDYAAQAAFSLGILLEEQGDVQQAEDAYQRAVALEHTQWSPAANVRLGMLHGWRGSLFSARDAYRAAIDSGHHEFAPFAAGRFGMLLAEHGDFGGAYQALQVAIDSGHPEHAPAALLSLGVLQQEAGEFETADATYRRVVQTGHLHHAPLAAACLGALLSELGDVRGAMSAFRRAVESGHDDIAPRAAVDLATLLAAEGDALGAREAYQTAIASRDAAAADSAARGLAELDRPTI